MKPIKARQEFWTLTHKLFLKDVHLVFKAEVTGKESGSWTKLGMLGVGVKAARRYETCLVRERQRLEP